MDVVLVSNRGDGAPHWSQDLAAEAARSLAAAGSTVRWLCALAPDQEPPAPPAGVTLAPVRGAMPAFRRIHARVADGPLDIALAAALRPRPADVVLHVGFGSPGSVNVPWLADRMGSACAAVVRAAEALCHRRTLVDEAGRSCSAWEDPERCTSCCTAPGPLPRWQSTLSRGARWLGGLSPWPNPAAFRNRLELALGSLQCATRIWVEKATDVELLAAAGIPRPVLSVGVPSGPAGWRDGLQACCRKSLASVAPPA